jgi:hypothetical protein
MVALAASASAVAPTITNLPAIIIGDAGGDASGALHLLRYENALNLTSYISHPNNPTADFLKVFYTVSGASLQASNKTAIVPAMSGSDLTSLLAGTAPAGKQIIPSTSDTFLSLINGAINSPASAHAATVAANGDTQANLTAAGALNPLTLTLWATDSNAATDKVGSGSLVVYSILGAVDAYSPSNVIFHEDPVGTTGWTYNDETAGDTGPNANLGPVAQLVTATGVGFTGVASFGTGKTQGFSTWAHLGNGIVMAPAANMANKIYKATMRMTGNATSPLLCPSYRVLFLSTGAGHAGGFQITTTGGATDTASAINMPSAATGTTGVETRLYWGVPTSTNQYGDGEKAATVAPGEDKRDYYMQFDIMQSEAGDIGTIVLESVTVERIARPGSVAPAIQWGPSAGGRAFNEAASIWSDTGVDGGTGWGPGTFTRGANSVTAKMQVSKSSVFCQFGPLATSALPYPAWTSNQLIRVSYTMASDNVAQCPQIRMFVLPYVTNLSKIGNTLWGEALDTTVWRGWYAFSTGVGLAGAPKPGGSLIETYAYTMSAPTAPAEASFLTPIMDIDQNTAALTNGWSAPHAILTVSTCSMEVLAP